MSEIVNMENRQPAMTEDRKLFESALSRAETMRREARRMMVEEEARYVRTRATALQRAEDEVQALDAEHNATMERLRVMIRKIEALRDA